MSRFSRSPIRRSSICLTLATAAVILAGCSSSTDADSEAQSAAGQLQGNTSSAALGEDEAGMASEVTADAGTGQQATAETTEASDPLADTPYVVFEDPQTGYRTADFYDADRQLFHFHLANETLVRDEGDIAQRNWVTSANELGPNGVFGSYRIRFGTENGEARAYFTEVDPPTICNLVLDEPNGLRIFRGTETPPMN